MKKLLLMAAAVSVAFTSCTNDTPEEPDLGQTTLRQIAFASPVVTPSTRAFAGEQGPKYSQQENFKIFAKWYAGDFDTWNIGKMYMDNVQVSYDKGKNAWVPTPVYYWPKVGTLTFAAYSPADATGEVVYKNTGLQITNFKENAQAPYDLMYSSRSYNRTSSTNEQQPGSYAGVDINFHHALASLKFTAKLKEAYQDTEIILKSITLTGVNNQGNFSENIDETTPGTYASKPAWAVSEPAVTEDFFPLNLPEKGYVLKPEAADEVAMGGTRCIVIPQNATNIGLKIVYTMQTPTGEAIEQTVTKTFGQISTDRTATWEIGKRYTYNIIIGLDEIFFSPEVEDWVESNQDVNI